MKTKNCLYRSFLLLMCVCMLICGLVGCQKDEELIITNDTGTTMGNIAMSRGSFAYQNGLLYFSDPETIFEYDMESGKTVFFKISKVVGSNLSASSGGILIPIPEAFKPVAECATGEASTEVLWKRGGYAASPVGSLSVSDQQKVRLYYDFSQDTPTSGTTLGATMIWICV